MPDNLDKRTPHDAAQISLKEPWEVRYWTNALGCTREELEQAVKAVGNSADAVKKRMGKS